MEKRSKSRDIFNIDWVSGTKREYSTCHASYYWMEPDKASTSTPSEYPSLIQISVTCLIFFVLFIRFILFYLNPMGYSDVFFVYICIWHCQDRLLPPAAEGPSGLRLQLRRLLRALDPWAGSHSSCCSLSCLLTQGNHHPIQLLITPAHHICRCINLLQLSYHGLALI